MQFAELVRVSNAVRRTPGRLEKIDRLADVLNRLSPDEVPVALAFLTGSLRQGRIGLGGSAIRSAAGVAPASEPSLTVRDVDAVFDQIAAIRGAGSTSDRSVRLRDLFARAAHEEQEFLTRLTYGELRQGADEGVLLEAVARAASVPAARMRRAAMVGGALAPVALAALTGGEAALQRLDIVLFSPVQPMLADSAGGVEEALADTGAATIEYKLDGARIQAHKSGDEVRIYSRSLRDVTRAIPDVAAIVRRAPIRETILDGEVIALRPDGSPHPFQVTMSRFGRKADPRRLPGELPLSAFFFDCLYANGASTIDDPLSRRIALVGETAPAGTLIQHLVAPVERDALAFAERARAAGHEGVMVKSLSSPYSAGRRGSAWLKVKQANSLDLVVLAAEWGSGRRTGTLSNLHLGARDTERGGFVMLGKTFKGLTDALLAWQTRELLAREIGRDRQVVFVRPELVAEIAFNEIQASSQYAGGLTLRFARVKRYRTDKAAAEADTFAAVQRLYARGTGLAPPVR
jgi:DNA ligase-1